MNLAQTYTIDVVSRITTPVVSVADLRDWVGQTLSDEDGILSRAVLAAVEAFEHQTGRYLYTTTVRQYHRRWCSTLPLYRAKVTSVTSVTYYDTDGQTQTLDAEDYVVDLAGTPASIRLLSSPSVYPYLDKPIYVTYVCGWSNPPEDVKQALLIKAAQTYYHRQSWGEGQSHALNWDAVCAKYKTGLTT